MPGHLPKFQHIVFYVSKVQVKPGLYGGLRCFWPWRIPTFHDSMVQVRPNA